MTSYQWNWILNAWPFLSPWQPPRWVCPAWVYFPALWWRGSNWTDRSLTPEPACRWWSSLTWHETAGIGWSSQITSWLNSSLKERGKVKKEALGYTLKWGLWWYAREFLLHHYSLMFIYRIRTSCYSWGPVLTQALTKSFMYTTIKASNKVICKNYFVDKSLDKSFSESFFKSQSDLK